MELATLQIAIDSRQTKTAKEWLDDLTRSGERAEKAMGGVGAGGRTAAAGNTAAAASARSATDALNQQEAAARRLTATIRHYASIVFGAFSAREIIRMADDWGQYASRLRIATEQSGDFIQVQQRMLDISNRVYKSFGDSAEMYIRTAKALQELGYSSKQAGDLVETLQYSLTVSAADSQKSAAVIDALSKSILTGKVAMDQFNTIVAYNPRLQQAMADAITKGSLSALQKMVADGKLTVSQLMKVTSEMERMGQEADRMPVTMEDAVQRMNNKLTAFFGRVNESTGAVNVLTDAVDGLGDALDRIDISAVARDFAVLSDTWELISEKATQVLDAVEEFGGNFESMLFSSENGVRVLGNSIVTSFEQSFLNTAKEVDALYDVFAGVLASLGSGFKTLGENIVAALKWAFEWGKYYAQTIVFEFEQAMVAVGWMDGSTIKVPDLPERAPFFKDLRVEADKAREAIEGTLGAHAALSHRIGDNGIWRAAVVAMDAYSGGAVKATGANTRLTQELDKGKKALTEAEKAQQAFEKQRRQYLNGLYGEISALQDQARGFEDQIALYGLAESAKYDLAIADLEAQKAALAVIDAGAEEIAILERKIELLHQMRGSQQTLERLDAEKQAWETWSRDVEQIFQQVGQSLTDAIFEGGKSGRDLIKDLFKTLTLRVLIQPVMSGLQGLFMVAGPAGVANAGGAAGSMMGSPTSLFSMFGGNSMGMGMSNVMSHLSTSSMLQGTGVGNWLMGQAGNVAGMSNLALGGAGLLGGLGANLIFGGEGHSGIGGGLGSTLGMALGGPLGAVAGTLIGGGLGSLFGDREPTTRREQRTQVEYAGGALDITKRDDRAQAGADQAVAQMTAAAVQSANSLFQQIGVDAAIDSFHAIMASSYAGDRDGVASGGRLRIGDELRQFGIDLNDPNPTIQGFGGWSSAETLPRLATDIQLSVLEAFQAVSDELPNVLSAMLEGIDIRSLGEQEAQALAERFASITQGATQFLAAVDQMPFEQLRDLSFDAAAAMVQFAGGIDGLLASQQTYYDRFYSDAERHGHAVDQLTQALAGVGVEMPALVGSTDDMLASYRALVESLDLNTEAGQQAYVTLMQTAGAFADVAQFAGQAAAELERAAEEQRRLDEQEAARRAAEIQRLASAERGDVIAARRAAEQAEREAFDAAVKSYEDGAKAFDELRQTLLSAGDAAGLLGATIERALSNPTGKYMAGGVEYDQPRWGADTTAAGFNYDWGVMQMRLARDLSDDISANALRIENSGAALRDLSPNLGKYSPVVGPIAQALTAAVVDASGDMGYAVRDSVHQAMLGVAQQNVYSQFASQGPGLASVQFAQHRATYMSTPGLVPGRGEQYGADVVAYGRALDRLTGRMQAGKITAEQFDAAVEALSRTMPDAAALLGDVDAQMRRIADAQEQLQRAGLLSVRHYFGQLHDLAAELGKTDEPVNRATAAIGRMNSWVDAFGISASAAAGLSGKYDEVDRAQLIAQAAGIAASVLTTADARKAAEALAKDEAFAGVGGAELRDMALLVDGIRAFDPTSWESAFIRISDALGTGAINQEQYAALFNYSLDVFEDTARATEQVTASFDRLRDAAKSLADDLLLDRDLTTLSFGQQYAEAQRQYQEVMRRAMSGDVDAAGDLDRVTRNFLDRSADSRDEIQYRRDFAVAVNSLRQIETSNPMKEMATEIKRLNREVEGLRADLRAANATVASNTNETTRELRRINATGIKVQA